MGIFLTIIFKTIENYFNRRNYRKLTKLNLLTLIKEMFHQSLSYKRCAEELKIELTNTPTFTEVSISSIGVFYQLGYKNLHAAFFTGIENVFKKKSKRRVAFNRLWSTLEYLTLFHQKSFVEFGEFRRLEKEANELRNAKISEAFEIVNSIRFTFHKEKIPKNLVTYCIEVEKLLSNSQKQPDPTNPKIVNDYFVAPLLELNRQDIDLFKDFFNQLMPVQLNSVLWMCSTRYQNQKNLIESYRKFFNHLGESFSQSVNNLKKSYRILFK